MGKIAGSSSPISAASAMVSLLDDIYKSAPRRDVRRGCTVRRENKMHPEDWFNWTNMHEMGM
jgi:hypothetical protein